MSSQHCLNILSTTFPDTFPRTNDISHLWHSRNSIFQPLLVEPGYYWKVVQMNQRWNILRGLGIRNISTFGATLSFTLDPLDPSDAPPPPSRFLVGRCHTSSSASYRHLPLRIACWMLTSQNNDHRPSCRTWDFPAEKTWRFPATSGSNNKLIGLPGKFFGKKRNHRKCGKGTTIIQKKNSCFIGCIMVLQ